MTFQRPSATRKFTPLRKREERAQKRDKIVPLGVKNIQFVPISFAPPQICKVAFALRKFHAREATIKVMSCGRENGAR